MVSFMDYLQATGAQITNPIVNLGQALVDLLPGLIAAIVVAVVGFIIGAILGKAVEKLCDRLELDKKLKEKVATDTLGQIRLSTFLGAIVKWYVFLIFLGPAVNLVQLGTLSAFLYRLVLWAPNLIVGIIIIVFGLIMGDWAYDRIKRAKKTGFKLLASVTRALILIATFAIALAQMRIVVAIAETSFLIILAGLTIAIAIPVGMGLGAAFKPHAKRIMDQLMKGF